jgi:hypothetical protein
MAADHGVTSTVYGSIDPAQGLRDMPREDSENMAEREAAVRRIELLRREPRPGLLKATPINPQPRRLLGQPGGGPVIKCHEGCPGRVPGRSGGMAGDPGRSAAARGRDGRAPSRHQPVRGHGVAGLRE